MTEYNTLAKISLVGKLESSEEHASAKLAEEIVASRSDDLTETDLQQLQKLLFDHLGCCYRGAHVPWGVKMREWAHAEGARGAAGLFGDALQTSVANAAFVNATAAHGLELDDTHDESISHPGAPVIATALAMTSGSDKPAAEIYAAIRAGYEVVGRVGAATNAAAVVEHGFHPTSLFAGFGAVATAACLNNFDAQQLQRAWGLMLSMAGGSMQFSQESVGTTVKRLHGGLAALHGVMAVNFVKLGIFGPEESLHGRYGLLNIFGNQQAPERLLAVHDDAPEIHRISFKAYPCCRFFHSTLDALSAIVSQHNVAVESIQRLLVGGPEVLSTQHVVRRPESEMAAQYSLPFALGAALIFGPRSVEGYEQAALCDDRILGIADRVEVVVDKSMQAKYPQHFGSWLEAELMDGSRHRVEVLDSIGTPANPMSMDALIDKFDSLVRPVNKNLQASDIAADIDSLDSAQSLQSLLARFCKPA
jgi:2-methylcitrate dehydratase PrpD